MFIRNEHNLGLATLREKCSYSIIQNQKNSEYEHFSCSADHSNNIKRGGV